MEINIRPLIEKQCQKTNDEKSENCYDYNFFEKYTK